MTEEAVVEPRASAGVLPGATTESGLVFGVPDEAEPVQLGLQVAGEDDPILIDLTS